MYQKNTTRRRTAVMITCLFLAVTMVLLAVPAAAALTHTDFICDPESTLSESTKSTIVSINKDLYKEKGLQIAICIVDGITEDSLIDFAKSLYYDWEMSAGVLLAFDLSTQLYCGVQSIDIDDILTNEAMKGIFQTATKAEFEQGNVDKAVMNTVNALVQFIETNVPSIRDTESEEAAAAPETDENGEKITPEEEKPSGFVTFMKVVLWIILILILLAVVIFVAALFNDDLGDFVRTYVFRKGPATPPPVNDYYDDRLYGQPRRNPNNPYGQINRQPRPRNGYDPYDDYSQQYRQGGQPPRQPRPQGNRSYPQGQSRGYNQPQGHAQSYPPNQQRRRPQGQPNPYQTQGTGRPNGNRRPPNGQGY